MSPGKKANARVSFVNNMTQTKAKEDYHPDEGHVAIQVNLVKCRKRVGEVEHRIPMLSYKTDDDISQIKRFLLVYYTPLHSKLELDMLNE